MTTGDDINRTIDQAFDAGFHVILRSQGRIDFKVGVESISIALESGSEAINKRIHRVLDWERAKRIVNYVRKKQKSIVCFWMVGFPGETMSELKETFKKAKEIRSTKALFSKVTPYPGTKLWETAKELDALTTDDRHSLEDPESMIDLFLFRSSKKRSCVGFTR